MKKIVLEEISEIDLKEHKKNDSQRNAIMNVWKENLSKLSIEIAYEDILGELQETLRRKIGHPKN